MRSPTDFSKVRVRHEGKTAEAAAIENARAAAIDKVKGKRGAAGKVRKIYAHLPKDQVDMIVSIYKKYNT